MVLDGVGPYKVREPMFEGIRVVLSYRGEPYSPAYVQGVSGAAFRIAGICPCAPTCSLAMDPKSLIEMLGYEVKAHPLFGDGVDTEVAVAEMVALVKDEVRARRPTLVWHAFTFAEWDVVAGFDESEDVFVGRGSYLGLDEFARAPAARAKEAVNVAPAFGVMLVGDKVRDFDARKAEIESLAEALRHARSAKSEVLGQAKFVFLEGLQAYDRWSREFGRDPARMKGPGDSYCHGVYRSTHRAAAEYLRELAAKHGSARADMSRAADCFQREAGILDSAENLLGWRAPQNPVPDDRERISVLLAEARDQYARGIDAVEASLRRISET